MDTQSPTATDMLPQQTEPVPTQAMGQPSPVAPEHLQQPPQSSSDPDSQAMALTEENVLKVFSDPRVIRKLQAERLGKLASQKIGLAMMSDQARTRLRAAINPQVRTVRNTVKPDEVPTQEAVHAYKMRTILRFTIRATLAAFRGEQPHLLGG